MLSPVTLALGLFVLGGALAHAQPESTRQLRRRSVTVTHLPAEIRIAVGVRTYFVFGFPIQAKAVEVDRTRIRIVDTGERSLITEALSQPGPGESWTLSVPLADGKQPARAEFALVSHPSEVDMEVEVVRGEQPGTACPEVRAPCAAISPAEAVVSGFINPHGVRVLAFRSYEDTASGFGSELGMAYRAATWVLLVVSIRTPPGQMEWKPTGATVTSKRGEARVRGVRFEPDKKRPGQGRVLVETDVPPPIVGVEFTLHLHGAEGASSFSIPTVQLPPAQESKP